MDTGAGPGVFSTPAVLPVDAPVCFFDGLAGFGPLARVTIIFLREPFPCKRGISLGTWVSFGSARRGEFAGCWFRFLLVGLMAWPNFVPNLSLFPCCVFCFVLL